MRALWLAVIGGALVGCTDDEPIDSPEATLDIAAAIEAEATFMFAVLHGTEDSFEVSETELVAGVAANVPLRWTPAGCAQVSHPPGRSFAITFEDCSGPRGLVHVTGTLELTFGGWPGSPVFHVWSSKMSANGSIFSVHRTAEAGIWLEGDMLHGSFDGDAVGPGGYLLDRIGGYSITWPRDSECSAISAMAESDRARMDGQEMHWFTWVGLTRCPGRCPAGFAIHRFQNEAGLRVDMDGTALATWTSMGRQTATRSGVFDLQCE